MRIFFIRHGKDDGNYRGGWSDMPLIDEGKRTSKKISKIFRREKNEYKIEKIISSDLLRTKQTTEIINEKLKIPVEYTEKLREMNNGEIAGMLNSDVEKLYPGLYYNTLKIDERYPGGESPIEFYNRITRGFEKNYR